MEVGQVNSEGERSWFERKLTQARASKGPGFKEKRRSKLGEIQMRFGDLYGVFFAGERDPDQILAGFMMHTLDLFPQSYPRPDLTHLPQDRTFESSDLWSLSKGAGMIARRGCAILLGLNDAAAILVYPIVKPWDLSGPYSHFERNEAPIQWPYAETLQGEPVWVQAMILRGDELRRTVRGAFKAGFESTDRNRRIIFRNPFAGLLPHQEAATADENGRGA